MHVQLDTNAIGEVLDSDDLSKEFAERVLRTGCSASISQNVLFEALGMNRGDYQLSRAERLLKLRVQMGAKFFLARGLEGLVTEELSRRVAFPLEVPTREASSIYRRLHMAVQARSRDTGRLDIFAETVRDFKSGTRAMSKDVQADLVGLWKKHRLTAHGVGEALSRYSINSVPDWIVSRIVRDRHRRHNYQVRAIYAKPKRFRAILGWSALANLVMYSELFPSDRLSAHPNVRMLKREANDWYDAAVAGSSAYCDLFVLDGLALSRRCEFLRGRGCLHFRLAKLSEFLGGPLSIGSP